MASSYHEFLDTKRQRTYECGIDVETPADYLYDWQNHVVRWALKKGRAAIFADCGLGKTPMQLTWADHIARHTGKPVLILAPLAVSNQTKREGEKFGIDVSVCRDQSEVSGRVNIANYEMLHHFDAAEFGGLVLDESSILKNYDGTYRRLITRFGSHIQYRLACTATPAPNDLVEICTHSEFLSILKEKEVKALFFRQDGNSSNKFILKGHAERDFWAWLAGWAMAIRAPSDLGYDDERFKLPPLRTIQHTVDGSPIDGMLFAVEARGFQEVRQAQRASLRDRVTMCSSLINDTAEPWLVWCNLNDESDALAKAIPDAVEVKGSDSAEKKTDRLLGFQDGRYRVLVTKPSIAGHGMNYQHCARTAFVGLSYSWEEYYQAIRRCWRFGQTREVEAHIVTASTEGAVVANIERKEREAGIMMNSLVSHMREFYRVEKRTDDEYVGSMPMALPSWMKGDCDEVCGF